MNSPPGEASATGVLVLLAQNAAWHSMKSASQASPRMLPEALMLEASAVRKLIAQLGEDRRALRCCSAKTLRCSTERSAL